MKRKILYMFINLITCLAFGQNTNKPDLNLGFEVSSSYGKLPDNWVKLGMKDYILKVDSSEKHSGAVSMLIEPRDNKTDKSFGCCALSIPAIYEGTQIEVRAYMKYQNVTNGPIGLLLRIDDDSKTIQFDNMQQKNIQGTSDWTMCSVKLSLSEDARKIYIGALLSGTGKLWVDDFQILIDGVDISKTKIKKVPTFKADADTTFDKGSNINLIKITPSKIDDLAILGKVWGFLKYYHPAVAKGDYNWDYELFRIMPKIVNNKSKKERNELLSKWVASLGEVTKDSTKQKIDKADVKINPDLDWITNNSILGTKLSQQLIQIKEAKRIKKHYYIDLVSKVGNPLFKNERTYLKMTYPDAGFRLLSLYRYWNIIQYYYPYKNLLDENWNDILKSFIPKFINNTSELDYKLTLLALIADVHDTHANIWGIDNTLQRYKGNNYAPLEIKFIENKAVVTRYLNDEYGKYPEIGDVIISINGKSVDSIVKDKLPLTPASNYSTQLRDIASSLLRTNDTILIIKYFHANSINQIKIKCLPPQKVDIYNKAQMNDTCYKKLPNNVAYIFPGNIKNNYLPEIMPGVLNSKGLIIDMRCYPSDFIVFSFSEYLLPELKSFVKISNGSIEMPGLFTFTRKNEVGKSNADYYKGKVIILVNETTQSQAEYTTMALRLAPKAVVIGSTTAGADGNLSPFYLPGNIRTAISGIGIYYPDGKETQRVGIVPDIEVKPTIKGIQEGRDELLEKAIKTINEN
jgi:hypothetical protein